MAVRGSFNKILALTGTILAWFPLLFPLFLSIIFYLARGMLHFDYLMPAELFPLALLGAVLLLWAALRTWIHRKAIALSMAAAIVFFLGMNIIALFTGLASGTTEPSGWPWILVHLALLCYTLSLLVLAILGLLLFRQIASDSNNPPPPVGKD